MTEKIVILALGWLMGLLAPAIVDAVRRRKENQMGRNAILAELREVSYKLATAHYAVSIHKGTVDRGVLQWFQRTLEAYAGTDEAARLLEFIKESLTRSDEQLAQIARAMAADGTKSLTLQKYGVPLLDSRVSALWSSTQSLLAAFLRSALALTCCTNLSIGRATTATLPSGI